MDSVRVEYQGNSVEMPPGETVIGRDTKCSLRFNDPTVSRKHLRLIRRQDEVLVEDLGSSNGTLLNGRKLGGVLRVVDGDKIRFGTRELTICITESDMDDPPTLRLPGPLDLGIQPARQSLRNLGSVEIPAPRSVTAPYAIVTPFEKPATQRCPKCAAPVTEIEDECQNCHYNWGNFRAMSNTDVRVNISHRKHERQPLALRIIYVSAELEIEASTRDLSESGVFVCSQVLDPVGTKCSLTILADGGPPLGISGVVRRVVEHSAETEEETGLGVQFVNVGPEIEWIRAIIARSSQPAA